MLIPFHKLSSNSQIHTWKKNKKRDTITRKRTSLEKEKCELKTKLRQTLKRQKTVLLMMCKRLKNEI